MQVEKDADVDLSVVDVDAVDGIDLDEGVCRERKKGRMSSTSFEGVDEGKQAKERASKIQEMKHTLSAFDDQLQNSPSPGQHPRLPLVLHLPIGSLIDHQLLIFDSDTIVEVPIVVVL